MMMQHAWQYCLDGVIGAIHIDGEHPPPQLGRYILKQHLAGDAGVVYQQGHGPPAVFNVFDHGRHSCAVGNIRLRHHAAAALIRQLLRQLLGGQRMSAVIDAHGPAFPGQLCGDGPADAPGGAGDQSDFFHATYSLSQVKCAVCTASITKKAPVRKKSLDKGALSLYSN